jgi:ABC-type bacteriocin/lantibiotic exporter with double-glycine peptidase domain
MCFCPNQRIPYLFSFGLVKCFTQNFIHHHWVWWGIIALQLISTLVQYSQTMSLRFLHAKSIHSIRLEVFMKILGTVKSYEKGDIITRLVNDVADAQKLLVGVPIHLFTNILYLIVITVILSIINLIFIKVVLICIPVYLLIQYSLSKKTKVESKKLLLQRGEIIGLLDEILDSGNLTKQFGLEGFWANKFDKKIKAYEKTRLMLDNCQAISQSSGMLLTSLLPILLLWIGSKSVASNELSIGNLFASYIYALRLLSPLQLMINSLVGVSSSINAVNRVCELLDAPQERKGREDFQVRRGVIEFKNVTFGYKPDKIVINNFSALYQPGRLNFIMGENGCGKSTLLKLITQIYSPQEGKILIDGMDTSLCTPSYIRKQISIASQNTQLISGTIKENVVIGNPSLDDTSLNKLIDELDFNNMLFSFKYGWNTEVNHKGNNVSGGQAQWIAFLRAILKNSPILLLDEITAYMDKETEAQVYKILSNLMHDKTIIIVTHKIPDIDVEFNVTYLNSSEKQVKESSEREYVKCK